MADRLSEKQRTAKIMEMQTKMDRAMAHAVVIADRLMAMYGFDVCEHEPRCSSLTAVEGDDE